MNLDPDTFRQRLLDRYPDAYVDPDTGRVLRPDPEPGSNFTYDVTALFQNARRETADIEHLVIEAELYDETGEVGNPAYPATGDVELGARRRINERGLTPAWEAAAEVVEE